MAWGEGFRPLIIDQLDDLQLDNFQLVFTVHGCGRIVNRQLWTQLSTSFRQKQQQKKHS